MTPTEVGTDPYTIATYTIILRRSSRYAWQNVISMSDALMAAPFSLILCRWTSHPSPMDICEATTRRFFSYFKVTGQAVQKESDSDFYKSRDMTEKLLSVTQAEEI
ncbi:hypothetical protein Tco_1316502 [Tanacetum coccineum]